MKYIRTKDGRIVKHPHPNAEIFTFRYEILKTADTIQKLCDEFIIVSDNYERPIISAMPFNELQLYAKGRTKYATCYGAIWTDKGLIYVAKMNEKGKLELL